MNGKKTIFIGVFVLLLSSTCFGRGNDGTIPLGRPGDGTIPLRLAGNASDAAHGVSLQAQLSLSFLAYKGELSNQVVARKCKSPSEAVSFHRANGTILLGAKRYIVTGACYDSATNKTSIMGVNGASNVTIVGSVVKRGENTSFNCRVLLSGGGAPKRYICRFQNM